MGFGCTVWYVFSPGIADIAPPVEVFPRLLDYRAFYSESFVHPKFNKIHFLETKYIYSAVFNAFENTYPFNIIDIPIDLSHASASASEASTTASQASTSASASEARTSTSQIIERTRPSLSD